MTVKVVTPPGSEPVSIEEAKLHLRVGTDADDDLISALIVAARETAEGFQNRSFITQTLKEVLDHFPRTPHRLPRPPVSVVTSIVYTDSDGEEGTVDAGSYFLDAVSGRLVLNYGYSWPSVTLRPAAGVAITYTAGYGAAEDVPARVKQAMLLMIGHWYEHREQVITGTIVAELPMAAKALLWQERIVPW